MPRIRVGVALLVPEPVAAEVDGLRRALGDGALGRIPPHLTLVPPVNVAEERLDEARALLGGAAAGRAPLRLQLGPPATFWPVTPVVYLTVAGPDLGRVHELRQAVFRPPLERPLTHDFVPHVTLADELAPDRIAPALRAMSDFEQAVTFGQVTLLQEGAGRQWASIFSVRLAARSVVGRGGLPLELAVTPAPREDARRRIGAPPGLAVTATRQQAVAGVAECRLDPGDPTRAELVELWVSPPERDTGVGSHLLAACLDASARELGAEILRCRIGGSGDLAGFLVHRGFSGREGWLERRLRPGAAEGRPEGAGSS